MKHLLLPLLAALALHSTIYAAPPPPRRHRIIQKSQAKKKVVANISLQIPNKVSIYIKNNYRLIESNGIPSHKVGHFPNSGNPHRIKVQKYKFRIPINPKVANKLTLLDKPRYNFGIGLNGVLFDPLAREYYLAKINSQWRYEATSGAIDLGLDTNNAHVQPNGAYHYHGMPELLIDFLGSNKGMTIVGWASDGFPVYARYGYSDPNDPNSQVVQLKPSYKLKAEPDLNRPNTLTSLIGGPGSGITNPNTPIPMGAFTQDYEFEDGYGDLDQCNGRYGVTPEFPEGIYYYVVTDDFPFFTRCLKGDVN